MIVLLLPVATLGLLLQRPPLGAVRLEPRAAIPRSVPHMIAPAESNSKATVASDERSKCAFFRVINPSSTSFKAWAADVDAGGIDATLATVFAWPLAALQNGVLRSMFTDAGIDIYNIDGYLDGILSHKDLMWPYRDEVASVLRKDKDKDGTVHINDIYAAKVFTANKYSMPVSLGSYLEVPLIFIKCGGDLDKDSSTYGRVPLENVLLFFNGDEPLKSNNLQSSQINFGTLRTAMSFTPPIPQAPPIPQYALEALEASGSYPTAGSLMRAQLALYGLTLMAAISQLPMILYKVATQVLCPAHWGKKNAD
mmetsp:Transcript_6607/g.16414  ORF Transcript_6607/g.16414 Transcript_6607/m.16414 type:complete len:310 (-) Transcript_6607:282-1211(-)